MTPVIVVDHVSKRYRRYSRSSLREALSTQARRLLPGSQLPRDDAFWAVRDLSFEALPGQSLGIIGPNGAGKTTTLKLLSYVTRPTEGRIRTSGRVAALIELGAGFHPDLTGRENIFLNGTILGMRRSEIAGRLDQIIEFAGLAPFIDTPVKYYSSGMYARLGFAVAAHTAPDVLLVDEVLAVGDYAFQQRCYSRIRELQQGGTAILLVSHNLNAVTEVCEQAVVLNQGRGVFQGPAHEAVAEYANVIRRTTQRHDIGPGLDGIGQRLMTHQARIVEVRLTDGDDSPIKQTNSGDLIRLHATIEFREDAPHPHFSCFVRDDQGRLIYDQTTSWQGVITPIFAAGQVSTVVYELEMNVVEGLYQIGIDLHYSDFLCYYDRLETAASVFVAGRDGAKGTVDLRCRVAFPDAVAGPAIRREEAALR